MKIYQFPTEIQVNILTYLRAYDLSSVQQTCKFYSSKDLVHKIVLHTAEHVYPPALTVGFQQAAQLNFESLRNLELQVVARVLNSPEPPTGFLVSKSWCKQALKWLETQEQSKQRGVQKLSKKKQRMRSRKLSDASPPWPNVNIDLLCEHSNLSRCSSKTARARRRVLDKQAWKILKKLYPDSTQLESCMGECLQCTLDAETQRRNELDAKERAKLERKKPLADDDVRRFYTRKNGVPNQCLVDNQLVEGVYYVLPRSWCFAWRKFIKTGEGGQPTPPDAASLLCHAHRLLLVPPHLDQFLLGKSNQLMSASCEQQGQGRATSGGVAGLSSPDSSIRGSTSATSISSPFARSPPGAAPDQDSFQAVRAAGFSWEEISRQMNAIRLLETNNTAAPLGHVASSTIRNDLLDLENYSVVEILSAAEYAALEKWFPHPSFALTFEKRGNNSGKIAWSTPVCYDCDASGKSSHVSIKQRSRYCSKVNLEY